MKNLTTWSVIALVSLAFSVSTLAQVGGAAPAPTKIGWIDTAVFSNEKTGVTRFVNALKGLDNEFKPRLSELEGLQARIKAIVDELQKPPNQAVPMVLEAKRDEGERLQRELEFKKKEFELAYAKKRNEVIGPLTTDILKVMREFAKQKGYVAILDVGSLAQANALLVLEPAADATQEFVAFYNARPPGAATAERR